MPIPANTAKAANTARIARTRTVTLQRGQAIRVRSLQRYAQHWLGVVRTDYGTRLAGGRHVIQIERNCRLLYLSNGSQAWGVDGSLGQHVFDVAKPRIARIVPDLKSVWGG